MGALDAGSPLLVLVVGAVSVENGHFSLGTMLGVVALANGFLRPISSLAGTGLRLQAVGSYMERISDVLDTPQEQEGRTLTPAGALRGRIEASHVSFRYTPLAAPAVDDVSVAAEPGRYVASSGGRDRGSRRSPTCCSVWRRRPAAGSRSTATTWRCSIRARCAGRSGS